MGRAGHELGFNEYIKMASQSLQARLSGLNHKYLFLRVLEVGKFMIVVLAVPVSDESSLLGLQIAIFLLYPLHGGGVEVRREA